MLFYRLRWYGFETGRLLRRHWQAIALGTLLLSPAMMPVFAQTRVLGAPVLAPLAPEHGILWRLAWVHLLEGCGLLWVLMQGPALSGGPFAAYLRTLPIPRWQKRRTDLTVLLLANTPILLPALAAAVALAYMPAAGAHYFYLLDLALLTFAAQLTLLARSMRHAPLLLAANLALVAGLQSTATTQLLCFGAGAVLALMLLALAPDIAEARQRGARSGSVPNRPEPSSATSPASFSAHLSTYFSARWLPPLPGLSARIVWHRYRYSTLGRGLLMAGLLVAAWLLMQLWQFDARARGLMLITQALFGLIMAATYRELAATHAQAAAYRAALPIARGTLAACDTALVSALALPFISALPMLLASRHALTLSAAFGNILAVMLLLLALRWPQTRLSRQAVVVSALLAGFWAIMVWPFFV